MPSPDPAQLGPTKWADNTLAAGDPPNKIVYVGMRRAADPSLRPADAEIGPGAPANGASTVSSITQAKRYLSAAEISALGL